MRECLLLEECQVAQESLDTLWRGESEAVFLKRHQARLLIHLLAEPHDPERERSCYGSGAVLVPDREVELHGRRLGLPTMLNKALCVSDGGGADEGLAVDEVFGVFAAWVVDVDSSSSEKKSVDFSAQFGGESQEVECGSAPQEGEFALPIWRISFVHDCLTYLVSIMSGERVIG